MSRYIARRLFQSIPIMFGITFMSFLLMGVSGNPLIALTMQPEMTQQQLNRVAARLGVNDPLPVQYVRWLMGDDWLRWDSDGDGISDHAFLLPLDADNDGKPEAPGTRRGVMRGDFGISFSLKRPVLDLIFERIPATLELSITTLIIGTTLGILMGVLAAVRRGGFYDNSLRLFAAVANSLPSFWLALMLLLTFAVNLRIFPIGDRCGLTMEPSCPPIFLRLEYMALPVFASCVGFVGGLARFMRVCMLDEIGQDYIRTARSKGLHERQIWLGHAARNALLPIATGLGPAITGLLGGSIILETIFNYPGLGLTLLTAATARDYPVVMAAVIYGSLATILGYLFSDILYTWLDPRIKFE
jgi:peptide/nickel transport system permease protein